MGSLGPFVGECMMRCRRPFLAVLWGCLALAVALTTGGCTLVDGSLSPRAFDINQGTQNVRESGILLNIVRASRSEPLNFVALSRYTGTGSLGANGGASQNDLLRFGTPSSIATKGIFTGAVNVSAGNAFDVGTLENRDFYGGFLSPLDLEGLNLLLNAGLSREVVFHSVMQAFRVTHTNGTAYLFENNPSDDSWQGAPRSSQCAALYDGRESAFEPVFLTPIWQRSQEHDCRYQKFLYFMRLAIRYGVTVEAIPLPQRDIGDSDRRRGGRDSDRMKDRERSGPTAVYFVCYDPAIANENGLPIPKNTDAACGAKRKVIGRTHDFQFRFDFKRPIAGITPVVRSPYAVFQFYGQLLATDSLGRVRLSMLSRRDALPREPSLLTIDKGAGDCFARALYNGQLYCVPNEGTRNTKEVFVLLNTLVAISTNRSALPTSPSFVLTP
jgi:hypothetical protein